LLRRRSCSRPFRAARSRPWAGGGGVAAAYAAGRLRAPARPAVDDQGTVRPYRPHVMFYVPYLTNADLGAGPGSPVFVISEGKPHPYAIVPVPPETLATHHGE